MSAVLSTRVFSALVARIYDCAVEPQHWPDTLERLRTQLGHWNSVMALQALPTGRVLLGYTANIPPAYAEQIGRYGEHIIGAWGGARVSAAHPSSEPAVLSRLNASSIGDQTNPYMRDWCEPQGITDCLALVLARDRDAIGSVAFGRHRDQPPIGDTDVENARLLTPHLQRAAAISRLLDEGSARSMQLALALDRLSSPVLLVSADAAVLHANRPATTLLHQRTILALERGHLSSPLPAVARALVDALARCARDESSLDRHGMGIPARATDGDVRAIHVLPLAKERGRVQLGDAASAAVFVSMLRAEAGGATQMLAALYELTPAEAKVCDLVTSGWSLKDAAAHLDISASTVRTHMLRIYDKVGVHRQVDLVNLASSLSVPVGP